MTANPDKIKPKTVSPGELLPELEVPPSEETYPFWAGCLPTCPLEGVDIAGIGFSKITETLIRLPSAQGPGISRVAHVGQIVFLSIRQLDLFCERLPLAVLRFGERRQGRNPVLKEESAGVKPAPASSTHHATLLKKPDPNNPPAPGSRHAVNHYVPREGDQYVAKYIFLVPAPTCARSANEVPPPPISETGIEYPGKASKAYQEPIRGSSGVLPAPTD